MITKDPRIQEHGLLLAFLASAIAAAAVALLMPM